MAESRGDFPSGLGEEKESLFRSQTLEGLITTLFVELTKANDSPRFGLRMTKTLISPGPRPCRPRPDSALPAEGPACQSGPTHSDLTLKGERDAD